MNKAEALLKASEIAAQNPMICGPCGGPLPNPECGVKKNGFTPCCIPASESLEDAIADALLTNHANAVREEREACAKVAESAYQDTKYHPYYRDACGYVAQAIRQRESQ